MGEEKVGEEERWKKGKREDGRRKERLETRVWQSARVVCRDETNYVGIVSSIIGEFTELA